MFPGYRLSVFVLGGFLHSHLSEI
ncbi:hypothetical protein HT737_07910 [Pseudomonas sp. MD195_PC81_125]|nr:hypothetical protein [Pseudomonas sp. MD195_PC81_125]